MSLLYRAQAYIRRQRGRTIVLFLLLFVIANITLAALSVQKGSQTAQSNLLKQAQSTVVYTENQQLVMSQQREGTLDTDTTETAGFPTVGNYLLIADSSYLSYSDATAVYEVTSETVDPYVNQEQAQAQQGQAPSFSTGEDDTSAETERPDGFVQGDYASAGDFTLNTFSNVTPLAFEAGDAELLEGRFATQDEIDSGAMVILIETNVAIDNGLSIGDTISLTPTIDGYTTEQTYEVIGIYESTATEDSRFSFQANSSLLTQNQMYVPLNTLKTIGLSDEEIAAYTIDTASFTLADPADADAFIEEASAKVDLTYSTLSADTSEYERVSASLSSVSSMSTTMILIVLAAAVVILSLIVTLSINQRKNEIGVLLSLGETKIKVVSQLIVETCVIASVAFILSCFSFSLFTDKITSFASSNQTLVSNVTNTEGLPSMPGGTTDSSEQPGFSFGVESDTAATAESEILDIDASLTLATMTEFLGIGLILCIISTTIPAILVMSYNPKKILSQN